MSKNVVFSTTFFYVFPFFDITIPISASTQTLQSKFGISIFFFDVIEVGDLRNIRGSS